MQDILENDDVKLDHMFIASLVSDIVKVGCKLFNYNKVNMRMTTISLVYISYPSATVNGFEIYVLGLISE